MSEWEQREYFDVFYDFRSMNVIAIQNSEATLAGYLGTFLTTTYGASLSIVRPEELFSDEDLIRADLVIALGSPRGAYENEAWIHREREFLRAVIDAETPLVGICFGAQLIASALNGSAKPMTRRSHGWYENEGTSDDRWRGPWLRWHGDEIVLPPGSKTLATSGSTIQAFQHRRAIGIQFHPEADQETLEKWIELAGDSVRSQLNVPALLEESRAHFSAMADQRGALFDLLIRQIMS